MNGREASVVRTIGWWIRLIVAGGILGFAATVVGRWFLDHVLQTRNSPAALVLLVLMIQLAWFVFHAPAGGVLSSLKIVLGGCALVGALLGPRSQAADWSWAWSHLEVHRTGVALLAVWVVVDGLMDRRANLRRGHRRNFGRPTDKNPTSAAITTIRSSDR